MQRQVLWLTLLINGCCTGTLSFAQTVEGMSGSPILIGDTLVGIQFGGVKKDLHAASIKTIREFLK